MAFGIINRFPGGTKDNYEAAVARVHPPDGLPDGQTFHVAGPTEDGWIVIALWDSEDSWVRFRNETLIPGLTGLGENGFPTPPEESTFEVHNFQLGER